MLSEADSSAPGLEYRTNHKFKAASQVILSSASHRHRRPPSFPCLLKDGSDSSASQLTRITKGELPKVHRLDRDAELLIELPERIEIRRILIGDQNWADCG